jgi:hypothetical protein
LRPLAGQAPPLVPDIKSIASFPGRGTIGRQFPWVTKVGGISTQNPGNYWLEELDE